MNRCTFLLIAAVAALPAVSLSLAEDKAAVARPFAPT